MDMDFFYRLYSDLPRQGPGDKEITLKAFSYLKDLPSKPEILDIGCGSGKQTIDLLSGSKCCITAVDNYQPLLDVLAKVSKEKDFCDRLNIVNASMDNLPFPEKSFDLLWCEGAIYNIGYLKGLLYFKKFLKDDGFFVVSELVWTKENPPKELVAFWKEEYSDVQTISNRISLAREAGYKVLTHFSIPDIYWWNDFYDYLEKRVDLFREEAKTDPDKQFVLDMTIKEMQMHRKFSDYYGYEFFILKKIG